MPNILDLPDDSSRQSSAAGRRPVTQPAPRMSNGAAVIARSDREDNTLATLKAPATATPSLLGAAAVPGTNANGSTPSEDTHQKGASGASDDKFGSAENDIAKEVAADIAECDRVNGAEDFFGSAESRIREKLKPAFKTFRRANSDPAYRAELVTQLKKDSGGAYTPSSTKPWCLAAFVALKPKTKTHEKQTYDAAYFFQHAGYDDVPLDGFPNWIDGRNLKASIAFVRGRKSKGKPKPKPYPNIAKAKKLKQHEASAKILKDAADMAEEELKELFEREPV